ncbi:MAG: alpha-L-fucosidase [Clostridiales bacterium]|nr:alpha-L-fucosidase [Clostridiales bacterium]
MADAIIKGMHGCSREDEYVVPADPRIREKLEWFQDQKLALMMHFGIYTTLGICESWPLVDGDAEWSRNEIDWEKDPEVFKEQYRNLNKSFNPARLRPEVWADVAARNGFRYFIFTTKHHDGFCLFDSKYTDYKTTSPDCPFHTHKYADVAKSVFDAFRARGIAIAAYFSKPDWHCPWYWAPGMDKPIAADRNPTYKPAEHPELWEKFVEFTHNQMMELVRDYGPIDILWLDGGQVRPNNGQDIRLSEFVKRAREINPTLLTADRTVGGENENYITPEQSVPTAPIRVPWESCVTVGYAFSYRFKERYKTSRQLVHLLIDVVCRGGNLALNIAPQPDGTLPADAVKSVDGMGDWLRENGDAIYGTRLADPNEDGITAFTKKGETYYALVRLPEGEALGRTLTIPWPHEANRLTLLSLGAPLAFERTDAGLVVTVPEILRGHNPIAPVIRIEK